jgi:hypothetical protein
MTKQFHKFILLLIMLCCNSGLLQSVEEDLTELPSYLTKKGLTVPPYAPRSKDAIRGMAILTYDLSDKNVAAMAAQYKAAQEAERKGAKDLALKIYWDLAFRGCEEAIFRVTDIFGEGQLGVLKNDTIHSFLVSLPAILKNQKESQKSILSGMVLFVKEWNALSENQQIKHHNRAMFLENIAALEHYLRDPVVAERAKIICPGILEVYPVLPLPPLESERRSSGSSDGATSDGASSSTIAAPEAVELHEVAGEIVTGAGESAPLLDTEGLRRRLVGEN